MKSYEGLVAMDIADFLKLNFGEVPARKIYQRCLGPHGDASLFWDSYLHPECVKVNPGLQNDFTLDTTCSETA